MSYGGDVYKSGQCYEINLILTGLHVMILTRGNVHGQIAVFLTFAPRALRPTRHLIVSQQIHRTILKVMTEFKRHFNPFQAEISSIKKRKEDEVISKNKNVQVNSPLCDRGKTAHVFSLAESPINI